MKRRDFLITTLLSSGLIITDQLNGQAASIPDFSNSPFTLGVASGDPQADRVIIWTRLAPFPLKRLRREALETNKTVLNFC